MVDWSRLQTAVGDATNAPLHLEALLGPESQRRDAAVRFLDEALHASTVWSAVPVLAVHLASLLGDCRMDSSVRAEVLQWMYCASSDAVESQEHIAVDGAESWGDAAEPVHAMLAARPAIYQAVAPFLTDPDSDVRTAAIIAGTELLAAADLEAERAAAQDRLLRLAAESPWRERAAIALALGRFGAVPTMLLHDEDWGVRVCLATSHGLDDDPSMLALVMEAFRDRRRLYEHFGEEVHPTSTTVQWAFVHALRRRRPDEEPPPVAVYTAA
ncbi:hypothetical protein [Dactylosporangium darangshiense]|uniref:HEAT repeat domain-containing protein n=1 Tax=Dactylosporangium darangshiense TaxID=579108 RepID=A0ABP8DAY9_9ACTN